MIKILPLETVEELQQCEALQRAIWGFEDISIVPHHLILTTIKNGGWVLGAFESPEPSAPAPQGELLARADPRLHKLIGFVYGFPGYEAGRLKHCSMMCGVLPEQRFQGIGYDLKLAQREYVLRQGLELITWTFDPLQSANAYFNFHKLGVIAQHYERNLYGSLRDRLNQGLDTDRFTVEWWIKSPRVRARVEPKRLPTSDQILTDTQTINHTQREQGILVNREYALTLKAPRLLVEVPPRLTDLKEKDLGLAQRWRAQTREIFEAYLGRGYIVSDFAAIELAGERRSFYLLEDRSPEEILEGA